MKKAWRIALIILGVVHMVLSGTITAHAKQYDYVVENGNRVPIPIAYKVKNIIDLTGQAAAFNQADDVFIDGNDFIYIADTGNNRIVKLSREGALIDIFTGPEKRPFNNPRGVFVDEIGDIFVADTGNFRIVHLDPAGKYIEEFVKPESDLLDKHFTFEPSKVYVSPTGYIYTMKGQQLLIIDAHNRFRGYLGAVEVGFDLASTLLRIFASKEQKERIARRMPPPYINFTAGQDGMIYAVTLDYANGQIKKLNSVGKNIYAKETFGEYRDDEGKSIKPIFADITVDENGIIMVIEQNTGKIYQYDQEGNMLAVFGGKGKRKGLFDQPVGIATDSEGNVYVLDKNLNNLQVFEPTKFIRDVHNAVKLYSEGKYEEALEFWEQVLKTDESYQLANRGKAKVLMKKDELEHALSEYKKGEDKEGYSSAFAEYRHALFRRYFGILILAFILLALIIYYIIINYFRLSEKILDSFRYKQGGV